MTDKEHELTQRIAELKKELEAIYARDKTMYDFRAHKEYIEKEVEAAERRGFEAARALIPPGERRNQWHVHKYDTFEDYEREKEKA